MPWILWRYSSEVVGRFLSSTLFLFSVDKEGALFIRCSCACLSPRLSGLDVSSDMRTSQALCRPPTRAPPGLRGCGSSWPSCARARRLADPPVGLRKVLDPFQPRPHQQQPADADCKSKQLDDEVAIRHSLAVAALQHSQATGSGANAWCSC
jgi:hypothetical protein